MILDSFTPWDGKTAAHKKIDNGGKQDLGVMINDFLHMLVRHMSMVVYLPCAKMVEMSD